MTMNNAEKLRKWRAANPDKVKEQKRRYKERHPDAAKLYREKTKERAAETKLEWQRKNKEKVRLSCKRWREANPDKNRTKALRYRVKKLQRTVKWEQELTNFVELEAAHLCRLREKVTGFKWHIDHVVPLCGENVSGLHVWNNMNVIPALVNISKHNCFCIE